MCGTTNPINVRGLPCALKPHLNEGVSRKVLGSFSQHGCQSSFLDWVKNFRRDAQDIEEEELLMCPMLWCRNIFKDADATVRHVFGCPRLTNGWYWCPYCKRPERFLECNKGCDIQPRPRLQKREPKLAITFFRWLGRRRSLRKIVDAPGKAEIEDGARAMKFDLYPNVGQSFSHAHELNTRTDAAYPDWVDEKAKYPGNLACTAGIAGSDIFRPELPLSQRVNVRSMHEMSVPTPFEGIEAGSDSFGYRGLDPLFTDLYDASVPTNLELPTVDPVYLTAELRDRVSCNIADAPTAIPSTISPALQAESSCDKRPGGADTLSKRFTKILDTQWSRNPFHDCYEELADICPSTPSLGFAFPLPTIASPSAPSPILVSQLSSAIALGSRASALVSPMSNVGSPTSSTQEVPSVSEITNSDDCINAWKLQSSTLPTPGPKRTNVRGSPAKPRANTTSANYPTDYHWYSNSEGRQIPVQIQEFDVEANQDHGPHVRTQVEELQGLVQIVNNEWMQRLFPNNELHLRCSSLSARTLFAKGIGTLEAWLCGKYEKTFEEVFSFMHIAFAAAFVLHHEDESYRWDAFFQDALQLRHALFDREGELLFLTAMDLWWRLPNQQIFTANANPPSLITCNASKELSLEMDQAPWLQELRDNKVFRACAGFLDDFEESHVLEKNMSLHSAAVAAGNELPRIGEGMEKIIRPLERKKGIEALQTSILDVSYGICSGVLNENREVEIALLSSGRRSSQYPEVFERFQSMVNTQCNTAMGSSDRTWRDQHYIADLTKIMDISEGLKRHRDLDSASKPRLDTSVLGLIRPGGASPESPTTSPFAGSAGTFTLGSSPTSLTARTSTDTSPIDDFSTPMTSPTAVSQASISPTSPTFSASTSHVEVCHLCGKGFKGTPTDARSNLSRHLRTSPRHNPDAGLKCPERDCRAKRMRSDNLGTHLKRRHGLTSPLELEQAKKKSRGLE